MDTAVKTKWVEALRSGDYEQTDGVLVRELPSGKRGYCCLGVLCDLAVKEGVISAPVRYEDTDHFSPEEREAIERGEETYSGEFLFDNTGVDSPHRVWQGEILPNAVMRWAGLVEQNPVITDVEGLVSFGDDDDEEPFAVEASSYNDEQGADFNLIADLIEKDGSL